MKNHQDNTSALPALLCADSGVNTLETNSLCCAAAGIIAPSSATAEALIPHEKLRGAALADATLNAQECPLAQPALGGKAVPALSTVTTKQPVFLTEVLKESVDNTEDMSNRQSVYAVGDHHNRSRGVQSIARSCNPRHSRESGKPSGRRLDSFIAKTISGVVFERVRDFTTHSEVRASAPQIQLEVCFGWRSRFLTFTPNRTLRVSPAVPDPLANVECRESAIDCKIARGGKAIRCRVNVTVLQLTDLPVQLRQHVVDTFHLKRMHRSTPLIARVEHCAPIQRRRTRFDQRSLSNPSISHDNGLRRRKI